MTVTRSWQGQGSGSGQGHGEGLAHGDAGSTGVRVTGPAGGDVRVALLAEAQATAERAARAADVTIVELTDVRQMDEACELLDRVWRPDPGDPLITPKLMKVLSHCGSYVVGVMRGDRMVGVCVGFLADIGLHSHIAGVDDDLRGRSLGYAVKLHQRAWSLARGIDTVTWTFDPLISRNAYFNLAKLGAVPDEYLADFYGAMHDEVNAGTETDRLLVRWDLASAHVVRALTDGAFVPAVDGGVVALDTAADGRPVAGPVARVAGPVAGDSGPVAGGAGGAEGAERLLVGVPRDAEALRRTGPDAARQWREALREVLGGLMEQGATVTGFTRDGWYVVERGRENKS